MIEGNENERLAAVESYQLMGTAVERDFDEITALAAQICQTPIALVTLLGQEKQWFKSHHGTPLQETDRSIAFCNHAIKDKDGVLVVANAREDERFSNNPLVTGEHQIVFYAGVPLINPDGFALGTLCVLGHEQLELNPNQISGLRTLARQALMLMEMRLTTNALEKQNEALARTNAALQEFARQAVHDLKNPLTSIMLNSQALTYRLRGKVDERTFRLAEMNVNSGKELTAMINQLLEEALTAHGQS